MSHTDKHLCPESYESKKKNKIHNETIFGMQTRFFLSFFASLLSVAALFFPSYIYLILLLLLLFFIHCGLVSVYLTCANNFALPLDYYACVCVCLFVFACVFAHLHFFCCENKTILYRLLDKTVNRI